MTNRTPQNLNGIIRLVFKEPRVRAAGPVVFLDRDGIINEKIEGGYVTQWESFRFADGITESIRGLAELGLPILVVSNQACVGKGLLSRTELEAITRRFVEHLELAGGRIDAVYYCPHTPDDRCGCRKPCAGLLEKAAEDWAADMGRSVFVGDSLTDLEAAARAGCKSVLVSPGEPIAGAFQVPDASGICAAVRTRMENGT